MHAETVHVQPKAEIRRQAYNAVKVHVGSSLHAAIKLLEKHFVFKAARILINLGCNITMRNGHYMAGLVQKQTRYIISCLQDAWTRRNGSWQGQFSLHNSAKLHDS
jgi:hypothetical protein